MPRNRIISTYANTWLEILIRIVMAVTFIQMEKATPFKRKIHQDELWLYRNPRTDSYVPSEILWPFVFVIPCTIFFLNFLITRNKLEFIQSNLGFSLAVGLNGILTNTLKLVVGRPRPDFFWRCFPDGEMHNDMECTGDEDIIKEGRKSFPSGHSSFSFVSMGFIALYFMGKLHIFGEKGRGQSWRLLVSSTPLFLAMLVALSRLDDYHHHALDVFCGSTIGISIAYMCYRQYYPSLNSKNCHRSYAELKSRELIDFPTRLAKSSPQPEAKSFLDEEKDTKWI